MSARHSPHSEAARPTGSRASCARPVSPSSPRGPRRSCRAVWRSTAAKPLTPIGWWPPSKIAGRYLAPYLARIGHGNGEEEKLLDIPEWEAGAGGGDRAALELALEAADADASWDDPRSALAWLELAERLAVVLPAE